MLKVAGILFSLLTFLSSPAEACMGYDQEDTVFFKSISREIEAAEIVANVKITDVKTINKKTYALARVLSVRKGKISDGDEITFEIEKTSCGPHHAAGEQGMITGHVVQTSEDPILLNLRTHSRGDDI